MCGDFLIGFRIGLTVADRKTLTQSWVGFGVSVSDQAVPAPN
jgi:hypothetical protein